jgi:hypothetical protein
VDEDGFGLMGSSHGRIGIWKTEGCGICCLGIYSRWVRHSWLDEFIHCYSCYMLDGAVFIGGIEHLLFLSN